MSGFVAIESSTGDFVEFIFAQILCGKVFIQFSPGSTYELNSMIDWALLPLGGNQYNKKEALNAHAQAIYS